MVESEVLWPVAWLGQIQDSPQKRRIIRPPFQRSHLHRRAVLQFRFGRQDHHAIHDCAFEAHAHCLTRHARQCKPSWNEAGSQLWTFDLRLWTATPASWPALPGCGAKRPCRSSGLRRGGRSARLKGPSPCSLIWLRAKTNAKTHEPCVQLEFQSAVWEKEVLAWWLCQHTTARRRWVSERLGMGDESRVTQAIGRLKRKGRPELEWLKRRLE